MKRSTLLLAAIAAVLVLPSCEKINGEGPLQTETRAISGFSGVSISIPGQVNYTIDPVYKVEITAQRNILEVIETSVVNGHLQVKIRNGKRVRDHEDIVVSVSAPSADLLHISGAGDLSVSGNIAAGSLDLRISGSGNIFIPHADVSGQLKATISGSGEMKLMGGTAGLLDLKISGSGKMIMDAVSAQKAVTNISGSGDIYLKLSHSLDASISGSGSVYYRGSPQITTRISGSGTVRPL